MHIQSEQYATCLEFCINKIGNQLKVILVVSMLIYRNHNYVLYQRQYSSN